MTFHHWEQASTGIVAVYRYSVPRAASHYAVSYCCLRETPIAVLRQSGGRRDATMVMPNQPGATIKPFTETPAYHGSLSIDPATGAILRITLEAELSGGDPLLRAATVVEYGPVVIGANAYVCPVRSLAFSMEESSGNGAAGDAGPSTNRAARPPTLLLNETSFTHYHRLGASVRVLADGSDVPASPPAAKVPAESNSATGSPSPSAAPISTSVDLNPPIAPPAIGPSSAAPAPPPLDAEAPAVLAAAAQPPAAPYLPEISLSAANGVPDEPVNAAQPGDSNFQLKLSSRLVDVGIVAYDKKGHPVKDLKAEDFEVYDNGKKQDVRFFNEFASAAAPPVADAAASRTFSNHAAETGDAPAADAGATVLLIDESHIAWPDMSHARQEILKFLGTVPPGERVGLYTMTPVGFRLLQEITTDHAALIARLQKWMPTAQSALLAQDEETRNRQSFNEVHSTADLNSVNGNEVDVPDAGQTVIQPCAPWEAIQRVRLSLFST